MIVECNVVVVAEVLASFYGVVFLFNWFISTTKFFFVVDSFPSSSSRVGEEEHHAVSIIPNPIKTPIGALQFLWSFRMHHLHGICPSTKHKWGFPFSCCCCLMQAMLPIRLACARYLAFPLATRSPPNPLQPNLLLPTLSFWVSSRS